MTKLYTIQIVEI